MDTKKTENEKTFDTSEVILKNRQNLQVKGVEKVYETSPTKLLLKIAGSDCVISGENMGVERLDVEDGVLVVNGTINSIRYGEKNQGNFLKRIFKWHFFQPLIKPLLFVCFAIWGLYLVWCFLRLFG